MGNSSSQLDKDNDYRKIKMLSNNYIDKYNLVPSLPGHEYKLITLNIITNNNVLSGDIDNLEKYIDLRNEFPNIIDIKNLTFNPLACVSYVIHYSMLKNKLPVFPPSMIYIFNNIDYFSNSKNILCFDIIFESIKKFGFCSENEMRSVKENLDMKCDKSINDRAEAYKFLNVYRLDNDLPMIKLLIKNKYPILVGFTVYYDISCISSYLWMPDANKDFKKGGLAGVIVGYIDDRKMFIMAETFGTTFGTSGFILIPYDYILNKDYTFEKYIVDFNSDRVNSYINQRRTMINIEKETATIKINSNYDKDDFTNLFS